MKIGKVESLKPKGNDGRYFTSKRKGELYELKQELHHIKESHRLKALKKVTASYTVGKDVSSLFSDVVVCSQTSDIQVYIFFLIIFYMKKLVYLYLMNHATTNQQLTLLSINSFLKDLNPNANPLIFSLSLRTLSSICLSLPDLVPYLIQPLNLALKDDDAYIRKTAATSVGKICSAGYSSFEACSEAGIVDNLLNLLNDKVSIVVSNALCSIKMIQSLKYTKDEEFIPWEKKLVAKLLSILNEASEWSQVYVLDCLSEGFSFSGVLGRVGLDVKKVIERVLPRLQHSNTAVITSAVRLLIILLNETDVNQHKKVLSQIESALVSAYKLNVDLPELQFVVLKSINTLVQLFQTKKFSVKTSLFMDQVSNFFVSVDEPGYLQQQKINLLVNLCSLKNINAGNIIEKVLSELKIYSLTTTDENPVLEKFVTESILSISKIAQIFFSRGEIEVVKKCIESLKVVLQSTSEEFTLNQGIYGIKDIVALDIGSSASEEIISLIELMCEKCTFEELNSALVFIIGEFSSMIQDTLRLLATFSDELFSNYKSETLNARIMLLTTCLKFYLSLTASINFPAVLSRVKYKSVTALITAVGEMGSISKEEELKLAENLLFLLIEKSKSSSFFVERRRAEFYSGLLVSHENSVKIIKQVILEFKSHGQENIEAESSLYLYHGLNFGTLSAIYEQKPENFVRNVKNEVQQGQIKELKLEKPAQDNLLGLFDESKSSPVVDDILDFGSSKTFNKTYLIQNTSENENNGFGLDISYKFSGSKLLLEIQNIFVSSSVSEINLQFRKNILGLKQKNKIIKLSKHISKGQTASTEVALEVVKDQVNSSTDDLVEGLFDDTPKETTNEVSVDVALRNSANDIVTKTSIKVEALNLVLRNEPFHKKGFVSLWQDLDKTEDSSRVLKFEITTSGAGASELRKELSEMLKQKGFSLIASRPDKDYFSLCFVANDPFSVVLMQADFSGGDVSFVLRGHVPHFIQKVQSLILQ
eukprot:maker-scaffold_30-snap-gene-1.7-mRNA-1 protein AED:0.18 eAED:0.18 QI:0/0.5/0.33/1/0.5/0.33/3/23/989